MHKYLATGTLNAWKIFVNNEKYIITPAHNVIYKKNNLLIKSDFIRKLDYNWLIPTEYLKSYSPEYDLAWTKTNDKNLLKPQLDFDSLVHANFYFLQPVHFDGTMTNNYSLGAMTGIIYQSPNSLLYEGINIGFRGMSGAICIDPRFPKKYLEMFVRLGKNLGSDINASTLELSETKEIKRGLIMTNKQIEKLILENKCISLDDLIKI
jgi:hypothetical protein